MPFAVQSTTDTNRDFGRHEKRLYSTPRSDPVLVFQIRLYVSFSQDDQHVLPAEITPIDLNVFLERKEGFEAECEKVGRFLHKYGILLVRDPVCMLFIASLEF